MTLTPAAAVDPTGRVLGTAGLACHLHTGDIAMVEINRPGRPGRPSHRDPEAPHRQVEALRNLRQGLELALHVGALGHRVAAATW